MMLVKAVLVAVVSLVAAVLLQARSLADLAPYESPISGVGLPPMAIFRAATKVSAMVDRLSFALKPPPVQLMSLVNGYQITQGMGAFARLNIAQAIEKTASGGMADVFDIAKATGTDVEALRRFLRWMSIFGVVSSDGTPEAARFGNTALSKLTIKDAPGSLWGAAVVSSDDHYSGWSNIDASLRKGAGTIAFDDKHGMAIWDYYTKHPEKEAAFASFMTGISLDQDAAVAMSGANFTECGAIVDVGGGHGSLMGEVVAAFPTLEGKATVVDLPSVVTSAPSRKGVSFTGGDFFESKTLPSSAKTNCYIAKVRS